MKADSKWIWAAGEAQNDQYAEFADGFCCKGGDAELRISADSNYAVWVNGVFAASGQYPDYPHYKVYDQIDLSDFCHAGENRLCIMVWHYGLSNMSYIPGNAALRYELWQGEELVCKSDETTLSRISRTFRSGYGKTITGQLGLSYWYDLSLEDEWLTGEAEGFDASVVTEHSQQLFERPVPKYRVGEFVSARLVWQKDNRHFLFDMGCESVGYLQFAVRSAVKQKMLVAWGEHIADGGVRREVGGRDFSVEYTLKAGENRNMNPFRRFGLRYLEVFCEQPVQIASIGIRPTDYPVRRLSKQVGNPLRQRIYDVSVRTLELCMHDHYEDTPWREQALYAMDSRNQMLCGYYAFGEYAFPRANLLLMSKAEREDGLLSICFPNADRLTIPSFTLHYLTAVEEYTAYSGDVTLLKEIWPKLTALIHSFIGRMQDGCVPNWTDKYHWNFYEWSDGLCGSLLKETPPCTDAALNCLFSIALQKMQAMADVLGERAGYGELSARVNAAVYHTFFDAEAGCFFNSTLDRGTSILVNALAILCGAVKGSEAEALAAKLTAPNHHWTPATLSMVCFLYDALLLVDREKYKPFILQDIDSKYQKMLDAGATSFWETEIGQSDFMDAGSLCHGWSSMPVYYYSILLENGRRRQCEQRLDF